MLNRHFIPQKIAEVIWTRKIYGYLGMLECIDKLTYLSKYNIEMV